MGGLGERRRETQGGSRRECTTPHHNINHGHRHPHQHTHTDIHRQPCELDSVGGGVILIGDIECKIRPEARRHANMCVAGCWRRDVWTPSAYFLVVCE